MDKIAIWVIWTQFGLKWLSPTESGSSQTFWLSQIATYGSAPRIGLGLGELGSVESRHGWVWVRTGRT